MRITYGILFVLKFVFVPVDEYPYNSVKHKKGKKSMKEINFICKNQQISHFKLCKW